MKGSLFLMAFILSTNTFADSYTAKLSLNTGEKQNIKDLKILENRYAKMIENRSSEMYNYFKENQVSLQLIFPEFKIKDLLIKMKNTHFEIVDEVLIDKNNIARACLNFPKSSKIKCKVEELIEGERSPEVFFALLLHEYLGLMGIEETSLDKNRPNAGYTISSRIVSSLTNLKGYDLVLKKSVLQKYGNSTFEIPLDLEFAYDDLAKYDYLKHKDVIDSKTTETSIQRAHILINKQCLDLGRKVTFKHARVTKIEYFEKYPNVLAKSKLALKFICD